MTAASAARRRVPYAWLVRGTALGGAVPVVVLALRAGRGALGANPIAELLNALGLLALVLLVASLACTPLKVASGWLLARPWTWPLRLRKTLGLLAFGYAALHFLTYAVLDQGLALGAIFADVVKRKFILSGLAAFLLLLPLALTSTDRAVRRLGHARWKRLHRLAYVAAGLGVLHFLWRVKKDVTEPLVYGAVLATLLLVRVAGWAASRRVRGA